MIQIWLIYMFFYIIFKVSFQIIRKNVLNHAHAMSFESLRSIFIVLLSFFLIPLMDFSFDKKALAWVYLVSLLATVGILFTAKALRHGQISAISPLNNLRPGFVAIMAFLFLSESISYIQVIGISIILISTYLLESDHHFSNFLAPIKHLFKSKYSLYFLIAVFLFSICSILDKFILTNKITNIYTYFFFIWIFITINFNLIHAFEFGFTDTINSLKELKYWPFLVALISLVSNLLFYKALSLTYVSIITPIAMLTTLFIVLFGGKFFHERYLFFRISISVLMLIGAYLVVM